MATGATTNDIKIEEVTGTNSEELVALFARGHHPPEDFIAAAYAYCGELHDLSGGDGRVKPEEVYQQYWRVVPGGGWGAQYLKAESGSPGAFPVTALDLQMWKK